MYCKEINKRSPMRVFERSTHGGLGCGNVGLVMSEPGLGKTPFLVGVALDDVMRDRKVLHVDMGHSADHVRNYYDEIFADLAKTTNLEESGDVHLMVERNRVIHSFRGGCFSMEKFREAVSYMADHMDFKPDAIVMDGFPNFEDAGAQIGELKALAKELNAELWLAATVQGGDTGSPNMLPNNINAIRSQLDVIVGLEPTADHVRLRLLKDHDSDTVSDIYIELDPTTLLMKWH